MSRFKSMAAHVAAASLGTLCLASYQLLHVMQHRLACHASLQINGCAHGSSIAWHVMPRFNSMAAHVAAASLGTSCLALYQLLHAMQNRLAPYVSHQLNGCAHGSSIAWHVMPRFVSVLHVMQHRLACHALLQINGKSMAVHMAAALLGTSCLASTQWLHTWQQHRAMLQLNACAHGSSITWHWMPCFRINGLDYASHANSCVA